MTDGSKYQWLPLKGQFGAFTAQYLVFPPFASITPRILRGMESYSVVIRDGLMECHSSFKAVASWTTLLGFGERFLTIRPRMSHKFSMGFKSGLRDGHGKDRMPFADLNSITVLAR